MKSNNNSIKTQKPKPFFYPIICFFIVFILMIVVLIIQKYAPFGNNCFAWMDGNVQYMDFFAYLKDVFEGKNNVIYTLSNMLGGTSIGILGYYLTSPLNVLILLFDKANIPAFFNILVILKLSLAGFTFSYYLQRRFNNKIQAIFLILLSISYALMQYNIAQASNIMWLDGVYMLPLILIGVYELVKSKKIKYLSITVGLSIIFNWYTGGINCLFSIFWFLVEEILEKIENQTEKNFKKFVYDIARYTIAMVIGVMLSAVIFLPNVLVLKGGRGSSFDWTFFKNNFTGNIISMIPNYSLGAVSTQTNLSIFCGTIPLLGCIMLFTSKLHNNKIKMLLGSSLLIAIMFCYWQPFILMFSLLKWPLSYWFRYSYVVIFVFIFIAANYYKKIEYETHNRIVLSALVFSFLLLLINYIKPINQEKNIYYTIGFILIIATVIAWYLKDKDQIRMKTTVSIVALIVAVTEMMYNTKLLMNQYQYTEVANFNHYQVEQEKQIKAIKEYDKGIYRISQTKTRNSDGNNLTANYNEALAFNYMSITSYTSTPDNYQLDFLNKLGYRTEGNNTSIVNTSIIGADSLLGVKYVLSPKDIKGLQKIQELPQANGKYVYKNPYALEMAIVSNQIDTLKEIPFSNPFDYQNRIYSLLLGKDIKLYKQVEFEKIETNGEKSIKYEITIPEGNYSLYGNLPWSEIANEKINVNGDYYTGYACSVSPSVFYIPYEGKTAFIEVQSTSKTSINNEQFYVLDLNLLKEATEEITNKKIEQFNIEDNKIVCEVKAKENEKLLMFIPYYNGMKVLRNGNEVRVDKFEECLITIPLKEGENKIEIRYAVPGIKAGIEITLLGAVFLILINKKKRNKEKNQ